MRIFSRIAVIARVRMSRLEVDSREVSRVSIMASSPTAMWSEVVRKLPVTDHYIHAVHTARDFDGPSRVTRR